MQMQECVGDLDAAWLEEAKSARLLSLPFAALRALLDDGATRGHENAVFYTVAAWLARHGGGCSDEQRATLVSTLRLPSMSSQYLGSVVAQMLPRLSAGAITTSDVCAAMAYALASNIVEQRLRRLPPVSNFEAWQLPARPESLATPTLEWRVALASLRALHLEVAPGEEGLCSNMTSPSQLVAGGARWGLSVIARKQAAGVDFGVFVTAAPPPGFAGDLGGVVFAAEVTLEAGEAVYACEFTLSGDDSWGFGDAFKLGVRAEWDDAPWGAVGGAVPLGLTIRSAL